MAWSFLPPAVPLDCTASDWKLRECLETRLLLCCMFTHLWKCGNLRYSAVIYNLCMRQSRIKIIILSCIWGAHHPCSKWWITKLLLKTGLMHIYIRHGRYHSRYSFVFQPFVIECGDAIEIQNRIRWYSYFVKRICLYLYRKEMSASQHLVCALFRITQWQHAN